MHDAQLTLEKSEGVTIKTIDGRSVYVHLSGDFLEIAIQDSFISLTKDAFQLTQKSKDSLLKVKVVAGTTARIE